MLINLLHNPYRRFCGKWWKHWLRPSMYWHQLVVWYQRATRGWSYVDTWSLDGYVADVMVGALTHLKETQHGVPAPDDATIDPDTGDVSPDEHKRWVEVWNAKLDEMISGFKGAQEHMDGPPDRFFSDRSADEIAADQKEADKYHAEHPEFHQWVSPYNYDMEGAKKWEEEQEKIRLKGFATFTKWFYALWD